MFKEAQKRVMTYNSKVLLKLNRPIIAERIERLPERARHKTCDDENHQHSTKARLRPAAMMLSSEQLLDFKGEIGLMVSGGSYMDLEQPIERHG
jgi:TPP-dependent indolepyruvate ferredoxin oxidoreductase alpha subunit